MRSHGEGETKPQGLPCSQITEVDVHAAGGLTPGGTETVAGADQGGMWGVALRAGNQSRK